MSQSLHSSYRSPNSRAAWNPFGWSLLVMGGGIVALFLVGFFFGASLQWMRKGVPEESVAVAPDPATPPAKPVAETPQAEAPATQTDGEAANVDTAPVVDPVDDPPPATAPMDVTPPVETPAPETQPPETPAVETTPSDESPFEAAPPVVATPVTPPPSESPFETKPPPPEATPAEPDARASFKLAALPGHILKADVSAVTCARISPDDRAIATGGSELKIRIWDAASGRLVVGNTGTTDPVEHLAYSPDNGMILAGMQSKLRFGESNAFPIAAFNIFQADITSLAFSPDGRTLAVTSSTGFVRLWEAKRPIQGGSLQDLVRGEFRETVSVRGVAFSPDSSSLAIVGEGGLLDLRSVPDFEQLARFSGHRDAVIAAAFSPDGKTLYSLDEGGELRSWNAMSGAPKILRRLEGGEVQAMIATPDGSSLLVGHRDGRITAWSTDGLAPLLELPAHRGAVVSLDYSHRGDWFVSGSLDGTVRLWRLRQSR